METHFPTVPLCEVPQKAKLRDSESERAVVLVVDEEPIIIYTLAAILDRSGFVAITAQNGGDALETARVIPPDVLVTDLVMQEMSGLDLAREIRITAPECEVILITGVVLAFERDLELSLAEKDFVTLAKPVFPEELLACISSRLAMRRSQCGTDAGTTSPAPPEFLLSWEIPPPRASKNHRAEKVLQFVARRRSPDSSDR